MYRASDTSNAETNYIFSIDRSSWFLQLPACVFTAYKVWGTQTFKINSIYVWAPIGTNIVSLESTWNTLSYDSTRFLIVEPPGPNFWYEGTWNIGTLPPKNTREWYNTGRIPLGSSCSSSSTMALADVSNSKTLVTLIIRFLTPIIHFWTPFDRF